MSTLIHAPPEEKTRKPQGDAAISRTNVSLAPGGIVRVRGQVVAVLLGDCRCPAAAKARSPRCVVVRFSTHVWTLEDRSCLLLWSFSVMFQLSKENGEF